MSPLRGFGGETTSCMVMSFSWVRFDRLARSRRAMRSRSPADILTGRRGASCWLDVGSSSVSRDEILHCVDMLEGAPPPRRPAVIDGAVGAGN